MSDEQIIDYIRQYKPDSIDIQEKFGWLGLAKVINLQKSGIVERKLNDEGVQFQFVIVEKRQPDPRQVHAGDEREAKPL